MAYNNFMFITSENEMLNDASWLEGRLTPIISDYRKNNQFIESLFNIATDYVNENKWRDFNTFVKEDWYEYFGDSEQVDLYSNNDSLLFWNIEAFDSWYAAYRFDRYEGYFIKEVTLDEIQWSHLNFVISAKWYINDWLKNHAYLIDLDDSYIEVDIKRGKCENSWKIKSWSSSPDSDIKNVPAVKWSFNLSDILYENV